MKHYSLLMLAFFLFVTSAAANSPIVSKIAITPEVEKTDECAEARAILEKEGKALRRDCIQDSDCVNAGPQLHPCGPPTPIRFGELIYGSDKWKHFNELILQSYRACKIVYPPCASPVVPPPICVKEICTSKK